MHLGSLESTQEARVALGYRLVQLLRIFRALQTSRVHTGNPGSVIVPQYGSSKITVFVWGKNIILKFLGNTK